jgi:hypothetical protein
MLKNKKVIAILKIKSLSTIVALSRLRQARGPVQERVIRRSTFSPFSPIHSHHLQLK